MTTTWRVLALALTMAGLAGCGGGTERPCGPATCNGCCDPSGQCQAGAGASACGLGGGACSACSITEACLSGGCYRVAGGSDGGACDGGGVTACGPLCVSTAVDPEHCGACFHKCAFANATAACVLATCAVGECKSGFRDLDGRLENGCEASCQPVSIASSGSLDVELSSVQLAGRITLEGRSAPAGTTRGSLQFFLAGTSRPVTVPLPASGEATFSTHLFQGSYRIVYTKASDCREAAMPCGTQELRAGFMLSASGSLDLDVKGAPAKDGGTASDGGVVLPITVSGEVTLGTAVLPDATSTRGTLELRQGSAVVATYGLGTTGRATYTVTLAPGSYDLALRGPALCTTGQPLPCQTSIRRKAVSLLTSGSFNLDVQVSTLSGEVRANGAALASATASRGQLRFADADGNGPLADLGATGPATYSVKLYPGPHSVTVTKSASCTVGPLPCQARKAVPSVTVLPTPASLDLDVPVISLSGSVKANGLALGNSASGGERGTLSFKDAVGTVTAPLGASGPATYQALLLYSGDYDVEVRNTSDCPKGPLPCGAYSVRKGVSLRTSGSYDVDLPVARLTGAVTVNGQTPGDSPSLSSRGQLSFSGPIQTGVALSSTGPATFELALYPGSYEVEFAKTTGDCPRGPTPCQSRVLKPALAVSTSGALALDLPVLELSGVVKVDGASAPVSATGADRGLIRFQEKDSGDVLASVGASGPAQYQLRLFPGTYSVTFENRLDCPATGSPPYPCQGEVLLKDPLSLAASGNLDFELKTVTLSGTVRLNGAALPASPNGVPRGAVRFGLAGGGAAQAPLSASGAATYSLRLLQGSYDLGFSNDTDCPGGATPCQDFLVKGCNLP